MEIKTLNNLSFLQAVPENQLPKVNSQLGKNSFYDLDLDIKVTVEASNGPIQHVTQGGACSATCASCAVTCGNCQSIGRVCR